MFKKISDCKPGRETSRSRVIALAANWGFRSAAVYSDADRASLHVIDGDEAYYLDLPQPANRTSALTESWTWPSGQEPMPSIRIRLLVGER